MTSVVSPGREEVAALSRVRDTKLVLRSRARLSSVMSAPAPPPPAATAERILALSRSHSRTTQSQWRLVRLSTVSLLVSSSSPRMASSLSAFRKAGMSVG